MKRTMSSTPSRNVKPRLPLGKQKKRDERAYAPSSPTYLPNECPPKRGNSGRRSSSAAIQEKECPPPPTPTTKKTWFFNVEGIQEAANAHYLSLVDCDKLLGRLFDYKFKTINELEAAATIADFAMASYANNNQKYRVQGDVLMGSDALFRKLITVNRKVTGIEWETLFSMIPEAWLVEHAEELSISTEVIPPPVKEAMDVTQVRYSDAVVGQCAVQSRG